MNLTPPSEPDWRISRIAALRSVALDGLAQALDSRVRENRTSRLGLRPAHLFPGGPLSMWPVHARSVSSLASARSAQRALRGPLWEACSLAPTPPSYLPWLHDHYSLLSYYGGSDPDRSVCSPAVVPWFTSFELPTILSPTTLDALGSLSTPSTPKAAILFGLRHTLAGSPSSTAELSSLPAPSGAAHYGLVVHFQLLSTRGYSPGAVTFSYWPYSVGQVRDSHPAVQMRSQAHERGHPGRSRFGCSRAIERY